MGERVAKASGRTLKRIDTDVSNPCRSSPEVKSTMSIVLSTQSRFEALKSSLPMPVYATTKFILRSMLWGGKKVNRFIGPP